MDGEVHRVRRALEEGGELVGLAVAVGVFEHADAVELRPLVLRRAEVRVALDDEQPALGVEVERDRVDDVRRGGEQFHHEPLDRRRTGVAGFGLRDAYRPRASTARETAASDDTGVLQETAATFTVTIYPNLPSGRTSHETILRCRLHCLACSSPRSRPRPRKSPPSPDT